MSALRSRPNNSSTPGRIVPLPLRKFARQAFNIKIEKGRGRLVVHGDILFS